MKLLLYFAAAVSMALVNNYLLLIESNNLYIILRVTHFKFVFKHIQIVDAFPTVDDELDFDSFADLDLIDLLVNKQQIDCLLVNFLLEAI